VLKSEVTARQGEPPSPSKLTEAKRKMALRRYPGGDKYYITMTQEELIKKLDACLADTRVDIRPFLTIDNNKNDRTGKPRAVPLNPLIKKSVRAENQAVSMRKIRKSLDGELLNYMRRVGGAADPGKEAKGGRTLQFTEESYPTEVYKFIERRLKYKYRDKLVDATTGRLKRVPYNLASDARNCGVQLLPNVRDRVEPEQKLMFEQPTLANST